MNRKRQIGLVVVAVGLLVAAFGVYTLLAGPSALADDPEDDTLTVEVENAVITLNVPMMAGKATHFIVIGDITEVNGEPAVGTYYCKGVFTDPGFFDLPDLVLGPDPDGISFVDQRFRIDGWGSIIGAGAEASDEPLAVTGGTGRFTGAVGSYTAAGLPIGAPDGDGFLTFEFSLRRR